jgi:hypothetical protein
MTAERKLLLAFCRQFCANKVVMDERRWVQAMDETYYTAAVDAFLASRPTVSLREFNSAAVPLSAETAALCPLCGYVPTTAAGVMCADCTQRSARDDHQLTQLMNAGHTYHCAARQTWGDGTCECCVGPHGPRVPGGL